MPERLMDWNEAYQLAQELRQRLLDAYPPPVKIWGIPRGGGYVAALLAASDGIELVVDAQDADVAVDDVLASGATAQRVRDAYGLDTLPLVDKSAPPSSASAAEPAPLQWVTFPWEAGGLEADAEQIVGRMLEQIGEHPNREGLQETPQRVVQAWRQLYSGYTAELPPLSASADQEPAQEIDVGGLRYFSICEAHLLPFYGAIGITGMTRAGRRLDVAQCPALVEAVTRRLQRPERIAAQIGQALADSGAVESVRIVVSARRLCLELGVTPSAQCATPDGTVWRWPHEDA